MTQYSLFCSTISYPNRTFFATGQLLSLLSELISLFSLSTITGDCATSLSKSVSISVFSMLLLLHCLLPDILLLLLLLQYHFAAIQYQHCCCCHSIQSTARYKTANFFFIPAQIFQIACPMSSMHTNNFHIPKLSVTCNFNTIFLANFFPAENFHFLSKHNVLLSSSAILSPCFSH